MGERKFERKPFGARHDFKKKWDKPGEGGQGRPFEKKPWHEKKSFGEKKPWEGMKSGGDKKPFGEKKPWGEKKPFSGPRRDKWGAGGPNTGKKPGQFKRKPKPFRP